MRMQPGYFMTFTCLRAHRYGASFLTRFSLAVSSACAATSAWVCNVRVYVNSKKEFTSSPFSMYAQAGTAQVCRLVVVVLSN